MPEEPEQKPGGKMPPATVFSPGDCVRCTDPDGRMHDRTGRVAEVVDGFTVMVQWDDDGGSTRTRIDGSKLERVSE